MNNKLTLEQSLTKIELIIKNLEDNDLDLPKLMEQYEEGIRLVKSCQEQLNKAEQSVKILRGDKEEVFEELS